MAAVDDAELVVVAGKLQRLVHFLIEQEPIARRILHVMCARGEISADRLRFELAHHRRKLVATTEANKTAAHAIHATEGLRPMPRRREGRDAAAAAAGYAAVVAVGGEVELVFLRHEGQQFIDEEAHIFIAHAVVFEIAIAASQSALHWRGHFAGPHEDADRHGHLTCGDHGFHHELLTVAVAVRLHVNAGFLCTVILSGDEDGHVAHGAGENLALREGELLDLAGQDVLGLDFGWRVSRRRFRGSFSNGTAGERLDEPVQMPVARPVVPQVDLRAGRDVSAEIVEAHLRRVFRRERVGAALLLGERPKLRRLAGVGFDDDSSATSHTRLRHRKSERRIMRGLDGEKAVFLAHDGPLLLRGT